MVDSDVVARIMKATGERVAAMRAELAAERSAAGITDGTLPLPFRCYGCDERRCDFCLMTGDGLPLCQRCFDSTCEAMVREEVG
jgi:hypothetical protein